MAPPESPLVSAVIPTHGRPELVVRAIDSALDQTLEDLDVDWMAGKSIGQFPLQRANAEAILPELQAIFAPFDPTGAEPSLIRFVALARMNAVLSIGADTQQMREVEQWVSRLDHGSWIGAVLGICADVGSFVQRPLRRLYSNSVESHACFSR